MKDNPTMLEKRLITISFPVQEMSQAQRKADTPAFSPSTTCHELEERRISLYILTYEKIFTG
jgi:hypothetical protein